MQLTRRCALTSVHFVQPFQPLASTTRPPQPSPTIYALPECLWYADQATDALLDLHDLRKMQKGRTEERLKGSQQPAGWRWRGPRCSPRSTQAGRRAGAVDGHPPYASQHPVADPAGLHRTFASRFSPLSHAPLLVRTSCWVPSSLTTSLRSSWPVSWGWGWGWECGGDRTSASAARAWQQACMAAARGSCV